MKKIILLPLFLPAVLVFLSSCKKESISTPTPSTLSETINLKVTPNQSYQMDLTNAGAVSISKQAIHFLVSETQVNSETGAAVYKYLPATDFIGNDEVDLVSIQTVTNYSGNSSGGCRSGNNGYVTTTSTSTVSKNIILKITVGN